MQELIEALVRNSPTVRWETWLTVLNRALADERSWMQAFESLSLEDQFGLLKALQTGGGIYGDALRIITARHSELICDEEVRDFLLADASDATGRLTNQLAQHRDELLVLIGKSEARFMADYDLATDVAHLERKLQELRRSEIGETAQEIEELDRDIHRLETFKRTLQSYDIEARQAYRNQLKAETTKLARQRKVLEDKIAAEIGKRDLLHREKAASEDALVKRTREVAELSAEVAETAKRIEAATVALADAREYLAGARSKQTLRYDVGLEVVLGGELAKELNASPGETVLMMPILACGSELPARFKSQDYDFYLNVAAGDSARLKVVIDDDRGDPSIQVWESAIPKSSDGPHECGVIVDADADGGLAVGLRYVGGHEVTMHGPLRRDVPRRSKTKASEKGSYQRRFTPQQFKDAVVKLRAGGAS
ncbi:hypothetical protein [Mycobacterium sp. SMC-4]|uniref:hypothetical protein n=1 Tax=Mycobacterium sp. SMC-4 TaxID=2857059 RepID=UPI0021B214BC|nr:hypothetical protein [Mycobacterium sp. SMC-4]UXA17455.1 hypothetical protein KXD98_22450 [Mycobacterium sp. SMC-4]